MTDFFEIKCLDEEEKKRILDKIKKNIAEKREEGILKEREIREIEEMKLCPFPDIQDVQSIYENFLFKNK
jgi:hypothetical protein